MTAGVAAQALCVFLLRRSRSAESHSKILVLGGLFGFALSLPLFVQALGVELGITWALVTISVIAYGMILLPFFTAAAIGHSRAPKRERMMPASPSGSAARLSLRLFSAGPLYLICALSISLLIATKPWAQEITRLFTGGLLTPLFWSFGALHATVDTNLWRVLWVPVTLTAVSAAAYLLI
ncbi:MAG: hypothetical protein AAFX56_00680 [Pseudomonadota bacterium]